MNELVSFDRRRGAIEGTVETDEERVVRERQEIKKARKEHAFSRKNRLRELDKARLDFRLAKIALGASTFFILAVISGWAVAMMWGVVASVGTGRGGSFAFYLIVLTIVTIASVFGLGVSIEWTYKGHNVVTKAAQRYSDALEASADYENELTEKGEVT